jgi:hypothetical protein
MTSRVPGYVSFVHLSHLVPFIRLSDDAPHIYFSLLLYVKTPLSAPPFPPFVWFKQVVLEVLVLPSVASIPARCGISTCTLTYNRTQCLVVFTVCSNLLAIATCVRSSVTASPDCSVRPDSKHTRNNYRHRSIALFSRSRTGCSSCGNLPAQRNSRIRRNGNETCPISNIIATYR